jgi:hypothetical protein
MAMVWLSLNALDMTTTHLAIRLGALEANPIAAGPMGTVGEAATYSLSLLIVLAATTVLYNMRWQLLLRPFSVLMALVVISNLAVVASSLG